MVKVVSIAIITRSREQPHSISINHSQLAAQEELNSLFSSIPSYLSCRITIIASILEIYSYFTYCSFCWKILVREFFLRIEIHHVAYWGVELPVVLMIKRS